MLLLYIFLLVMLFSSIPYLILFTRRSATAAELKRAIDRAGYKFRSVGAFWCMDTVDGKHASFYILKDGRVISVKVIGFMSSGIALDFKDKNSYGIKKLAASESEPAPDTYKTKKKSPYDFKAKMPEEWKRLPYAKIILVMDPYPAKLTRSTANGKKNIKPGDDTGEGELHNISSFLELIS